ncbi:hypothetical protein [Kribbia dieselivorans]|uniref:hypothetical protein n=1 Tax=Kribbia dieselivorans TaxID=331526 RepID=UPI000837F3D0|nr:hypothetical protein [Kribbia dieselivorans]
MQPSSLIFVAVIAVWAAYLARTWIRRREDLATTPVVEEHSEAMRVLDVRHTANVPVPEPVIAEVSPGRERVVEPRRPSRLLRALPGLTLLTSLFALPALIGLAAFSIVPWWAVGVDLAVLVAAFVAVRITVKARRRRRHEVWLAARAARSARPAEIAPIRSTSPRSGAARPVAARPAPARVVAAPVAREHAAPLEQPVAEVAIAPGRAGVEDGTDETPAPTVAELVAQSRPLPVEPSVPTMVLDDDDMPLTWDPVPVPPPTYTLKRQAERYDEPAPAPVAAPAPAPVVETVEPPRRAAQG